MCLALGKNDFSELKKNIVSSIKTRFRQKNKGLGAVSKKEKRR